MPSEIGHVVYAEYFYHTHLQAKKLNLRDYFIGTLFPDIRHIAGLKRRETHIYGQNLDDVLQTDGSFNIGFKVHSYIDIQREKVANEVGVYEGLPSARWVGTITKLVEEEIVHDKFSAWDTIRDYLSETVREEDIVPKEKVRLWHDLLREYFQKKPDASLYMYFFRRIGVTEKVAQRMISHYKKLKQNKNKTNQIREMVERLLLQ